MIIYDVVLQIAEDKHESCVHWLVEEHIREVLKVQGFVKAEVLLEPQAHSRVRILYYLQNEIALETYLKLHAPILRAKTQDKWGAALTAERTTWALYGTLSAPK